MSNQVALCIIDTVMNIHSCDILLYCTSTIQLWIVFSTIRKEKWNGRQIDPITITVVVADYRSLSIICILVSINNLILWCNVSCVAFSRQVGLDWIGHTRTMISLKWITYSKWSSSLRPNIWHMFQFLFINQSIINRSYV